MGLAESPHFFDISDWYDIFLSRIRLLQFDDPSYDFLHEHYIKLANICRIGEHGLFENLTHLGIDEAVLREFSYITDPSSAFQQFLLDCQEFYSYVQDVQEIDGVAGKSALTFRESLRERICELTTQTPLADLASSISRARITLLSHKEQIPVDVYQSCIRFLYEMTELYNMSARNCRHAQKRDKANWILNWYDDQIGIFFEAKELYARLEEYFYPLREYLTQSIIYARPRA